MPAGLPWMQPSPQGKALDSGKTPKTNVACTHCRRGCLAKREIIADERKYVQNFLVQQFPTVLLVSARSGSGKNPGDLLDKQRRRQIPEVVRAAPMLKNE